MYDYSGCVFLSFTFFQTEMHLSQDVFEKNVTFACNFLEKKVKYNERTQTEKTNFNLYFILFTLKMYMTVEI